MKLYLKIISIFYFIGFVLHVLDFTGLRLEFNQMTIVWKAWIIYLMVFDLIASIGLWQNKVWGIVVFQIISYSQLIAYLGLQFVFGEQWTIVIFHILVLSLFYTIRFKVMRKAT